MRRASRTDGPHAAIVQALRKVGCQVKDTSRVGDGFPDLIVRADGLLKTVQKNAALFYWEPKILLMEVKTARGKLNAEQQAFLRLWPETLVVRSVDEALQAVGVK